MTLNVLSRRTACMAALLLAAFVGHIPRAWASDQELQRQQQIIVTEMIKHIRTSLLDRYAVRSLGRLGPTARRAAPLLREIIEAGQGSSDYLYEATLAFGRIDENPVPTLTSALRHDRWEIRVSAALALGELGSRGSSAVPELLTSVRDGDFRVRAASARALGQLQPYTKLSISSALLTALGDKDGDVRREAIYSLRSVAVPTDEMKAALKKALKDRFVQLTAADLLRRIGGADEEAVEILVREILDREPNNAAEALPKFGAIAQKAVPQLLAALDEKDRWRAQRALEGLQKLGPLPEAVVPYLVKRLRHDDRTVRREAATWLAATGLQAQAAVPALLEALKDAEGYVRSEAVEALGRIGPTDAVISEVRKALDDPEAWVRAAAVKTWEKIGPSSEAIAVFMKGLHDKDDYVRICARTAFERLVGKDPAAAPALLGALRDESPLVREAAAIVLGGAAKDRPVRLALEAMLSDADARVRFAAAISMVADGRYNEQIKDALTELLTHRDEGVRGGAVYRLSKVANRDPVLLPLFVAALKAGENWWSYEALRSYGPAAAPAVPELVALMDSKEDDQILALLVEIVAHKDVQPALAPETTYVKYWAAQHYNSEAHKVVRDILLQIRPLK